MSWSYSGDPAASEKDGVRYLVGDTNEDEPLVTDEEIQFQINRWLEEYGTLEWVASMVAEALSAKYAREATYSADGVSIGLNALQAQFSELAVKLRQQHHMLLVGGSPDVGGVSPGERTSTDIEPFDFGTGMHDNSSAGRQNFGNGPAPEYWPYQEQGI